MMRKIVLISEVRVIVRMGNNLTILKVNHEVRDDEDEGEEEGFVFHHHHYHIVIVIVIIIIIAIIIIIIKEGHYAAALSCLV